MVCSAWSKAVVSNHRATDWYHSVVRLAEEKQINKLFYFHYIDDHTLQVVFILKNGFSFNNICLFPLTRLTHTQPLETANDGGLKGIVCVF